MLLGAAGAAAVAAMPRAARAKDDAPAPIPKRAFGKTGAEVSVFGLGCFPLGAVPKEDEGVAVVVRALEAGCTYLDTAPSYSSGQSERRVGLAIKGRDRASVFLATKTHTRTKADARRDLEGSLKRLGVERVDLIQVHAIADAADLDRALAPGGPLAALEKAREEKLVRFIGVTGHADPAVMRAAVERWPFDSILFPLNAIDPHHLSFGEGTLPAAARRGLARVAMKVFASGKLVAPEVAAPAEDCLRYAYGLDVATAVVGCGSVEHVDLAARVAAEQRPLSGAERAALLARTRPHAGPGAEWYKRKPN
jgi:aryl-alcohol dehydrogenase-like predicted oxidoreductase